MHDEGFTLIELLVVIVIIGVLSAIAVPVFLHQRQKGYDAKAKSDLRNLAQFEEIYLNDSTRYGSGMELLAAPGTSGLRVSSGVTLTVVSYEAGRGYCLSARHTSSPTTWFYDALSAGQQPKGATGCPTAYATADGVPLP